LPPFLLLLLRDHAQWGIRPESRFQSRKSFKGAAHDSVDSSPFTNQLQVLGGKTAGAISFGDSVGQSIVDFEQKQHCFCCPDAKKTPKSVQN
jgi:hypothetical protein